MKPEELSKQKYIWRIYYSRTDEVHIEKYPVIYVNKEYVYFKTAKHSSLDRVCTSNVEDCISESVATRLRSVYASVFFWIPPLLAERELKLFAKEVKNERLKNEIKNKVNAIGMYESRLQKEKEALDKLLKEKEKADEVV